MIHPRLSHRTVPVTLRPSLGISPTPKVETVSTLSQRLRHQAPALSLVQLVQAAVCQGQPQVLLQMLPQQLPGPLRSQATLLQHSRLVSPANGNLIGLLPSPRAIVGIVGFPEQTQLVGLAHLS